MAFASFYLFQRSKAYKMFGPEYFSRSSTGRCNEHYTRQCNRCMDKVKDEYEKTIQGEEVNDNVQPKSITLVPLDVNNDTQAACVRAKSIESFEKQVQMVQTVLGYDDEKIEKLKVSDLKALTEKAKKEATVGHMRQLLKAPGFIDKLICKIK